MFKYDRERVLSAQKLEEETRVLYGPNMFFKSTYRVAVSLTHLAGKSRFMAALQANAESGPGCVMYHWLSILGTDTSWDAVFTAMLQCQTCGQLWLVNSNFTLLRSIGTPWFCLPSANTVESMC